MDWVKTRLENIFARHKFAEMKGPRIKLVKFLREKKCIPIIYTFMEMD